MTSLKRSTNLPNKEALDNRLYQSRALLADQMWWAAMILALISIPLTVWRGVRADWPFYLIWNLCIGITAIFFFFIRTRFETKGRFSLLILFYFALGVTGLAWMGMVGSGYLWIIQGALLASTLFSFRAGIILTVISIILVALTGIGYISGLLEQPDDVNAYLLSPGAWATFLIVTAVMPTSVIYAIHGFQKTILELLNEVDAQRNQLEKLATHDQLTGLPVMLLATDRLQVAFSDARRSGEKVALLFIDLDGFKAVNDTYGHEAGDGVLKEVAVRLTAAIRDGDTAARIGGDEFMAVLTRLADAQMAAQVAQRIIDEISQPIHFSGNALLVGASIGIAIFPDHAEDPLTLRRLADEAMYQVKRSGKNHFVFFEP